jgi:predicted DNA-binding transcriptional regulator AlpA
VDTNPDTTHLGSATLDLGGGQRRTFRRAGRGPQIFEYLVDGTSSTLVAVHELGMRVDTSDFLAVYGDGVAAKDFLANSGEVTRESAEAPSQGLSHRPIRKGSRTYSGDAAARPSAPREFMSVVQLVDYLGLSRATIHRMRVAEGFPKPLQLGPRRIAFRLTDVQDWLTSLPVSAF